MSHFPTLGFFELPNFFRLLRDHQQWVLGIYDVVNYSEVIKSYTITLSRDDGLYSASEGHNDDVLSANANVVSSIERHLCLLNEAKPPN